MSDTQRYLAAVVLLAMSIGGGAISHARPYPSAGSLGVLFLSRTQVDEGGRVETPAPFGKQAGESSMSDQDSERRLTGERPRLLAEPFQTPHQLLRLLDIGPSDLDSFVDGQPISATDQEAFLKVLFRMPQIGLDDIARWAREPISWEKLQTDTGEARGEFFLLRGRVQAVARHPVQARLAALFAFDHYFAVDIELEGNLLVRVCTRTIPEAWQGQQVRDQRCRVSAMFLKRNSTADAPPRFLFAAPRIAWLPDRTDRALGIGPDQVLLGNLGMDVGLFDEVRARNGRTISAAERECFYALLHAAGRATAKELAQHTSPVQLGPLLQRPQKLHGEVLHVLGSVQRITRVVVEERDIQQRFGIDAYYQLDVLVPLGDTEIEVEGDKPGQPGPVYRSNFPFTCCALSIPKQWEPLLGKERAGAPVVLDGFFFKLWAYSNPYVASFDPKQRQLSPMLVLHQPTPVTSGNRAKGALSFVLGAAFVVVLAVIWVGVWLLNRADRQHASSALRQRFTASDPPDLRQLEQADD